MAKSRPALDFFRDRIIFSAFVFSLLFFLWQRNTGFSWDFATYVLDAQYLAGSGFYFEWARQPLPSLMMLALSFFGWASAEYLYIVAVSLLHLFSSVKFAEKFRVDKTLFYLFSLNAYVLVFGQKLGSELLSLAMLQLFMAYIYERRAGIFAGLAVLARYSNLNFLVFMLLQRKPKKIFVSVSLLFLVLLPWLYFNYSMTGQPLTSVRDSYMLNVVFRRLDGYVNAFSFRDLLLSLNVLLPFAALGIFGGQKRDEKYYAMILFMLISIISYYLIPHKEERYLFPITLPAAYFAAKAVEKNKNKMKYAAAFAVATIFMLAPLMPLALNEPGYLYKSAGSGCMAQSNAWVALSYYGVPSEPYPNQEDFSLAIQEGYRIVLFGGEEFPVYMNNASFMSRFPVIEENDGYVIYGDSSVCKPPEKYELLFINRVLRRIEEGDIACDFLSCRYLR